MGNLVFFHECKPKDLFDFKIFFTVPIGIPFHGVDFSIKKNELIVEGPMITNGYLSKNQTEQNFIINKNKNNVFFTGDYVKKYKSKLILTGRKDKMVKINGYRIEINEVESSTMSIDYVKFASAVEIKLKNNKNYLAMAVFLNDFSKKNKFYNDIRSIMPDYMVPKKIFFEKKIPYNQNNKVNKKIIRKKIFTLV
jgi:D-alanine--poly(phosphoribitol) ligase subunit 1